jgi:phage portal protein BeeE
MAPPLLRDLWRTLRREPYVEQRYSVNDWLSWINYAAHTYQLAPSYSLGSKQEEPGASFEGYAQAAYNSNGIVFACNQARMRLFAEARFQFRQLRQGRPGDLFGTSELAILENPWPGGTTRDLLKRAIQDVDIAGNFYAYRQGPKIRRMRPDWVSIVLGSKLAPDDPASALDAEVIGYMFHPGGYRSKNDPIPLLPEEVCHFAPIPDPLALFRGMTWLTPIIREYMADNAATDHKLSFFQNGATVNLALSYPEGMDKSLFDKYVEAFKLGHEGIANAYRTLHLGGGATPVPVGSNMEQIDFKIVQGAGETRIAAAAGVPPIVVGLSEGLEAATYSNYGQARRAFADGTMRDLWADCAGSLATIIRIPSASELWYDDRNISFLQEDERDAAEIQGRRASTVNTLIIAGYEPKSVVDAVDSDDFSRLKHTGLFSVQLQPAGTQAPDPKTNGKAPVPIGANDE